ncbi:MAG: oligosaccharide flippase family protein [Paludibacteraceae bacterium]|nr:oligosaccharide flippase family protein [Paludibacteraceae bacterium]
MSDVIWLLALKGLNYIAPILVLPYLMMTLGAEKYGYIGFSLAVCQMMMLIVDFGFDLSATKEIALAKGNQREVDRIYTETVRAKWLLLTVTALLVWALSMIPRFFIYRETLYVMFLMVVGHAFSFVWLLQGLGRIRVISIINTLCKLSVLPLTFVFVHTPADFLVAALIQSMVYLLSSLVTYVYIQKKGLASSLPCSIQNVIMALRRSFPIFFSNAATSIYTVSIAFFLGWFGTAVEVGRYSAVDRLVRALTYMILFSVIQAFYPRIVQMNRENQGVAVRYVRKVLVFVAGGMALLGILLFAFSPLAESLLGTEYVGTGAIFRLMAWVPLFVGSGGVYAQLVLLAMGGERERRRYRNVYSLAAVLAFACIFLLIPVGKAMGAAGTVLIVEVFVAVGMAYCGHRLLFPRNAVSCNRSEENEINGK